VVRASAVVDAIHALHPDARIDFLTSEPARPVIEKHPALATVWSLRDLPALPAYDWIINLQASDPPASFLAGTGLSYTQILDHLSHRVPHRVMSGRRVGPHGETTPTNIMYCVTEMEEVFLTALLPHDVARYPPTHIDLDTRSESDLLSRFVFPTDRPVLGLYVGSNSVGCGYDEGFRTYSIEFLDELVRRFHDRFTIVVIGQSQVRNEEERERYAGLVTRYPRLIDLVDRTSLTELVALMARIDVLIACDSGPIHIAMARGVPVVGLYANNATFALSPTLEADRYVAFNSYPPCFRYSWRWKYFCSTCRDPKTRAHYCRHDRFAFAVDRIPLGDIDAAVERLLRRH
jgi:ADP-heptose:LPS heptosyltransferase